MNSLLTWVVLVGTLVGSLGGSPGELGIDLAASRYTLNAEANFGDASAILGAMNRPEDESSREDKKKNDKKDKKENFGDPSIPLKGRWPYECEEKGDFKCDPKMEYQTTDGRCNNLKHTTWGQTGTCLDRLLPPEYKDDKAAFRRAKSGKELPNAREISTTIHDNKPQPEKDISNLLMPYGQFIDAELLGIPQAGDFDCCDNKKDKKECSPIEVPKKDPFYPKYDVKCLNFVRSKECKFCTKGPRQQPNHCTAFIDGSSIYGSDSKTAKSLRLMKNGYLLTYDSPTSGDLLPQSEDPKKDSCSYPKKNLVCFRSGFFGVNESPPLTIMNQIFVRQHNRIATGLKDLNPKWDDQRIFYEARRIIAAQMQMITYNEYLPVILGKERSKFFSIPPLEKGYTKYQDETNPSILQEFAVAAFRVFHGQIQSFYSTQPRYDRVQGRFLRDMYFFPFALYHGETEFMVRGLLTDPVLKVTRHRVPDTQNYLYRREGNKTGEDLMARDITRGRDHGLPGYTKYVRFCNGPKISDFKDLDKVMSTESRKLFEKVYKDVQDIDLVSGASAETHYPGALMGPTATCIIGLQFYHAKFGDRYYFEHDGKTAFKEDQLKSLRKTNFAKIICETTNILDIQRDVFLLPSKENQMRRCNEIEDIDLSPWKDKMEKKKD